MSRNPSGNPTYLRRREERLRAEEYGRLQRRHARLIAEAAGLAFASAAATAQAHYLDELCAEGAQALAAHKPH